MHLTSNGAWSVGMAINLALARPPHFPDTSYGPVVYWWYVIYILLCVYYFEYSVSLYPYNNFHYIAIKKLECIKLEIEQLRDQNLFNDANIEFHQQLQECVKLCESSKEILTEEHQELDAKHGELVKEKKELNMQLELLKQRN